jgi:hypothetical protein
MLTLIPTCLWESGHILNEQNMLTLIPTWHWERGTLLNTKFLTDYERGEIYKIKKYAYTYSYLALREEKYIK